MEKTEKRDQILKVMEKGKSNVKDTNFFDNTVLFLTQRKSNIAEYQKLSIELVKEQNGQEKFWITDYVFAPNIKNVKAIELENTFEIFPSETDNNGHKKSQKIFTQNDFDEMLSNLLRKRTKNLYQTNGQKHLFEYTKTPLKNGRKTNYPVVVFEFFTRKNESVSNVVVSTKENDKFTMQNVNFKYADKVCKTLNEQKNELIQTK